MNDAATQLLAEAFCALMVAAPDAPITMKIHSWLDDSITADLRGTND